MQKLNICLHKFRNQSYICEGSRGLDSRTLLIKCKNYYCNSSWQPGLETLLHKVKSYICQISIVCVYKKKCTKITCIYYDISHIVSHNSLANTVALVYASCSTANQPVLLQVDWYQLFSQTFPVLKHGSTHQYLTNYVMNRHIQHLNSVIHYHEQVTVQALSGEDSQPMITNISKQIFVVLASLGKIHQKRRKSGYSPKAQLTEYTVALCFLNVLF